MTRYSYQILNTIMQFLFCENCEKYGSYKHHYLQIKNRDSLIKLERFMEVSVKMPFYT